MTGRTDPPHYDLVGVGIGPFNLSLAALADSVPELSTLFLDAKPTFSWHPGLLLEGTVLQVPFLADLVTMADPTSRWSYLNYLREHGRMFPFFFSERFHIPRREYDHYCRWVAEALPSCRFDARVVALCWDDTAEAFRLTHRSAAGRERQVLARQVVLGVGTDPRLPRPLQELLTGDHHGYVLHSADYREHRARLAQFSDVTVIGAGQSGAEVALDLIRRQSVDGGDGPYVRWLARTPAFAPMEYSKLGLEHFTPDYIHYFRALPEARRSELIAQQWQLYKAVSAETLGDIHDELYERTIGGGTPRVGLHPGVEIRAVRPVAERAESGYLVTCRHRQQGEEFTFHTDALVSATGYAPRRPDFLSGLAGRVQWDDAGRYRVDGDYQVALHPAVTGRLYVQNAEAHTHGVGAPDLTLGAWRAATILNAVCDEPVVPVPERTAWTTFAVPTPGVATAYPHGSQAVQRDQGESPPVARSGAQHPTGEESAR